MKLKYGSMMKIIKNKYHYGDYLWNIVFLRLFSSKFIVVIKIILIFHYACNGKDKLSCSNIILPNNKSSKSS